jgi:hypothetical protein
MNNDYIKDGSFFKGLNDKPKMVNDTISVEDIQEVITDIFPNETFTEKEIAKVQELYSDEAESDPTGYWRLWVENLLYQTIGARETGGL